PTEAHRTPKKRAVLLREQRPYLRTSRFQGHELLQRKDNSSPGPRRRLLSVCVTALGPEGPISVSGLGNINPFPFVGSETNTSMCLRFGGTSRFGRGFLRSLRTALTHFSTAVHMEPFSSFSPQGFSLEYLLLPPRSAPVAAPGGLTPGTFNARHRDPPTHCGVNLHEGSSAVAARYRPNAGASSIFRVVASVGELFTHSLANSDFHGLVRLSRATNTFHGVS
ncbi:hypothetical protein JTE90_019975, partial [Oedothorax gibbosus]